MYQCIWQCFLYCSDVYLRFGFIVRPYREVTNPAFSDRFLDSICVVCLSLCTFCSLLAGLVSPDVRVDLVSAFVELGSGTFIKCDRFRLKTLSLLSVIRYDLGAIYFLTFSDSQFVLGSVFAMTWSPLLNLGSDAVC